MIPILGIGSSDNGKPHVERARNYPVSSRPVCAGRSDDFQWMVALASARVCGDAFAS
jgi:hypothetical protein